MVWIVACTGLPPLLAFGFARATGVRESNRRVLAAFFAFLAFEVVVLSLVFAIGFDSPFAMPIMFTGALWFTGRYFERGLVQLALCRRVAWPPSGILGPSLFYFLSSWLAIIVMFANRVLVRSSEADFDSIDIALGVAVFFGVYATGMILSIFLRKGQGTT